MGTYSTPSHGTLLISLGLQQAQCLGLGQGLVNLLGEPAGAVGLVSVWITATTQFPFQAQPGAPPSPASSLQWRTCQPGGPGGRRGFGLWGLLTSPVHGAQDP